MLRAITSAEIIALTPVLSHIVQPGVNRLQVIDKGEALITLPRNLSGVNYHPHGRIRDQERANAVGIVNPANL